jgi:hypothetical protein
MEEFESFFEMDLPHLNGGGISAGTGGYKATSDGYMAYLESGWISVVEAATREATTNNKTPFEHALQGKMLREVR